MTGFGTATIDLDLVFWSAYTGVIAAMITWVIVRNRYFDFSRGVKRELDYQLLDESILTKQEFDKRKEALRAGLDDWLEDYSFQEHKISNRKPEAE